MSIGSRNQFFLSNVEVEFVANNYIKKIPEPKNESTLHKKLDSTIADARHLNAIMIYIVTLFATNYTSSLHNKIPAVSVV
jgi:hypothetical protein